MKKVQDFVAGLTRSRKSAAKIKKTISAAYEDKAWRFTSIYFVIMKVNAGKTTDTKCHLSAKENQEYCWYCCRCCCQCEERPACHLHGYHLWLWGCQMGQSATFSKKTIGWSRNGSFTGTKISGPCRRHCSMWITANKIQLLRHPPYLLDLALEAYFFFWGVKEVLASAL